MSVRRMQDTDWEVLMKRIKDGRCTPFLGAGVYSEGPSLRTAVAKKWAAEKDYPFSDSDDVASVARFLNVEYGDAEYASGKYVEELSKVKPPNFDDPNEPYNILAKLPLPIYVTTNYDDMMEQALRKNNRDVKPDLCKWVKSIEDTSPLAEQDFKPNVANPCVFHLYGYTQTQQSMIISEDDYFQFLINVSKDHTLIPKRIEQAITGTSLMLLGYSLEDWDFRILFHFLAGYLKNSTSKTHVAVQLSPSASDTDLKQRAQAFFDKYFASRSPDIRVSWETTQKFVQMLGDSWQKSGYAT
ncbi:MAG TPA: SIR2 family protein [Pyrinomonadaceae bacterium]|nr:SIR2 family protein [Pyrinomonadaceae bacterium]